MTTEPRAPDVGLTGSTNDGQPCDLLVVVGRVLNLAAEAGVHDNAAIAIRAGFIVSVGDEADILNAWRPLRRIDATGHVVAPGFVDAHVHLLAFLGAGHPYQKAITPGPFSGAGKAEQVLPMIAQLVNMPAPTELTHAVLRPALVSMLRSGITGVADGTDCESRLPEESGGFAPKKICAVGTAGRQKFLSKGTSNVRYPRPLPSCPSPPVGSSS